MEDKSKILQKIGLTEYESRVMAALFSRSETTALDISKVSGVPITKLYSVLKSLENRGFLKCTLSRPKMFRPLDPAVVVDSILTIRQEKLRDTLSERDNIVSVLNSLYNKSGKKYETEKNIVWLLGDVKTLYLESLRLMQDAKKSICLISTPEDLKIASSNVNVMNVWMDAVLNRGIVGREIEPHFKTVERRWVLNQLLSSFKTKKEKNKFINDQTKYCKKYKVREIPKNKEIYFTMLIKDDDTVNIAFKHPVKKTSHSSITITDEKVVKGMLDYFESLWNISKPESSWEKLLLDARKSLL